MIVPAIKSQKNKLPSFKKDGLFRSKVTYLMPHPRKGINTVVLYVYSGKVCEEQTKIFNEKPFWHKLLVFLSFHFISRTRYKELRERRKHITTNT